MQPPGECSIDCDEKGLNGFTFSPFLSVTSVPPPQSRGSARHSKPAHHSSPKPIFPIQTQTRAISMVGDAVRIPSVVSNDWGGFVHAEICGIDLEFFLASMRPTLCSSFYHKALE